MSQHSPPLDEAGEGLVDSAAIFAALGDATRLGLLTRLAAGEELSISSLTRDTGITRQAVTQHLAVLAEAGLVRDRRLGREHVWQIEPLRLAMARRSLDQISRWWDEKLADLKASLEA